MACGEGVSVVRGAEEWGVSMRGTETRSVVFRWQAHVHLLLRKIQDGEESERAGERRGELLRIPPG